MIVFVESFARSLATLIEKLHRDSLFLQSTRLVSCVGTLLRAQRKFILHLASNSLLLGVNFGGIGHVQATVGVEQRYHERVFELALAQAETPTRSADHVGRLRH